MKTLQILILEDNIDDAQNIINLLSQEYSITLVNTLVKAKEALGISTFDLAILDIDINGKLDGIEFAKYLQQTSSSIPFLFLTSMQSKTVFNAAKLTKPFTYLLKPFNTIELQYTIELAIEKYFQQEDTLSTNTPLITTGYLMIKKQQTICKLILDDIEYIEVEENYSTLYTLDEKYVVKKSLAKLKPLLTGKNFEQIHRKFLVNFNKIKQINLAENTVYLNSNAKITISDRYKKQLTRRFDIIK
ncbi:DNA-binding response regulator [Aquimarina sp. AD10]|uniref:LytR/AlgR family response regulator transcription factor n=1 Tax=Aquimarina sp. AD10 TaxID=1714849 RepID=UPI000E4C2E6F|nr:LytTR family DNA-binding domain-containing protein [Aquimarina sp. AD10]AXT62640.1 DNA-binding response regulator [Aquimarina sp. AD10]RKM98364.1 response regulator [Aquimarina sp. AD10]